MRWVDIQPRVPEHRDRDLWRGYGEGKRVHVGAQVPGVSFGNRGDQVGCPRQCQCGCEAADDHGDLPFKSERLQGFVDGPSVETAARDADVAAGRITVGGDLGSDQGVPRSEDTNKSVREQRLSAYLPNRVLHYADFEISSSLRA